MGSPGTNPSDGWGDNSPHGNDFGRFPSAPFGQGLGMPGGYGQVGAGLERGYPTVAMNPFNQPIDVPPPMPSHPPLMAPRQMGGFFPPVGTPPTPWTGIGRLAKIVMGTGGCQPLIVTEKNPIQYSDY
jgi:hypothetical protein